MKIEYGAQCPAYESYICSNDRYNHCQYCDGCKARFIDGVECGYSPKPNCVPKFKEGQVVYRFFHLDSYEKSIIRKVEWDGKFQWRYTMKREQHSIRESLIFATQKEIDTYIIEKHAKGLMEELMNFSEQYHIPIESLKQKLIKQK